MTQIHYNYKMYFGLYYMLKADQEKPLNFGLNLGLKYDDLHVLLNNESYLVKTVHFDDLVCLSYHDLFTARYKKFSFNVCRFLRHILELRRHGKFPYAKYIIYTNLVCMCLHEKLLLTHMCDAGGIKYNASPNEAVSTSAVPVFESMNKFMFLPNVMYYAFTPDVLPFVTPSLELDFSAEEITSALNYLVIGANCYSLKQFSEFMPMHISANYHLPPNVTPHFASQNLQALLSRVCSGHKVTNLNYGAFTKHSKLLTLTDMKDMFDLIEFQPDLDFPRESRVTAEYKSAPCPNYYYTFPVMTSASIIDRYYGRVNDLVTINAELVSKRYLVVYGPRSIGKTTVVKKYMMMQCLPSVYVDRLTNAEIIKVLDHLLHCFSINTAASETKAVLPNDGLLQPVTTLSDIIRGKVLHLKNLMSVSPVSCLFIFDNFPVITEAAQHEEGFYSNLKLLMDFLLLQPTLYFIAIVEDFELMCIQLPAINNKVRICNFSRNDIMHLVARHIPVKQHDMTLINEFIVLCSINPPTTCSLINLWREYLDSGRTLKDLLTVICQNTVAPEPPPCLGLPSISALQRPLRMHSKSPAVAEDK